VAKTKAIDFKVGGEDFMPWSALTDRKIGHFRNILPSARKPISKCSIRLQIKMKTPTGFTAILNDLEELLNQIKNGAI